MLVLFLFLFLYNSSSTCDSFHPAVFLLGGVRKWFGSVVVSSFLSRNSLSLFTSTQSAAGAENETPAWRTEVFQPQKCSVPCSLFLFSAGCIYLNWFEARLSHGFICSRGAVINYCLLTDIQTGNIYSTGGVYLLTKQQWRKPFMQKEQKHDGLLLNCDGELFHPAGMPVCIQSGVLSAQLQMDTHIKWPTWCKWKKKGKVWN